MQIFNKDRSHRKQYHLSTLHICDESKLFTIQSIEIYATVSKNVADDDIIDIVQ